jgi:hypothetical protein
MVFFTKIRFRKQCASCCFYKPIAFTEVIAAELFAKVEVR